ncbi:hypothetical protein P691DRAFT_131268 [Macrolepiota fuliginosa MF-IS2]|uniref:Uncharacterized protein n=1 Tax=Macrolepiota fuliginosa MF-IS2 TaxID=1400762 RepID=A0A9P5XCC6_9AGAR|nr:hypothetical protein P691DRAFT_131268 [Macrolepiota fuliginosa MF-IS2]
MTSSIPHQSLTDTCLANLILCCSHCLILCNGCVALPQSHIALPQDATLNVTDVVPSKLQSIPLLHSPTLTTIVLIPLSDSFSRGT